jgi:hypothetical protein
MLSAIGLFLSPLFGRKAPEVKEIATASAHALGVLQPALAPASEKPAPVISRTLAPQVSQTALRVSKVSLPFITEAEKRALFSKDFSLPKGSPSEAELDAHLATVDFDSLPDLPIRPQALTPSAASLAPRGQLPASEFKPLTASEMSDLLSRDFSLPKGSPSEAELDAYLATIDFDALPDRPLRPQASNFPAASSAHRSHLPASQPQVKSKAKSLASPSLHSSAPVLAKAFAMEPRDLLSFVGTPGPGTGVEFSDDMPVGEDVVRFYTMVEGTCEKINIAPDGHCLFRATGLDLIQNLRNHPEHFARICSNLDRLIAEFSALPADQQSLIPNLQREIQAVKMLLDPTNHESPSFIMNTQMTSDGLVEALRKVSTAYNLVHPRASFADHLTSTERADFNSYVREMCTMKEHPKFGAGLEIEAMSELFGVNFLTFSFNGDFGNMMERYGEGSPKGPFTISTFYRGAHYDLLNLNKEFVHSKLALDLPASPIFD